MMIARLSIALCLIASPAAAACYDWPLREVDGRAVYDGDTVHIIMPGLPPEIAPMAVRLRGIDTPEIAAQCDEERYQATASRDYLNSLLESGRVAFCAPEWGRYGGRLVATVTLNERDVAEDMVAAGFARRYDGGERRGWCE